MTGFVRGALAVTAGLALLVSSSMAGVPSPTTSSVDPVMVGNVTGNPLKGGSFGTSVTSIGYTVVVRDIGGVLLDGVVVTLDFNTASGDNGSAAVVDAYEEQIGGATCAGDVISGTTGAGANPPGTFVFTPIFGGAENTASIEVRAGGTLLALVRARSTDLDANADTDPVGPPGPTGLPDLGIFQNNLFDLIRNVPGGILEADFTISPSPTNPVGLADLGLLQSDIFSAGNVEKTTCI